ncbi:hypothetical protein PN836_015305 [Ningiella sp. W23]|uniref:hypothetical protein n=1 Tax=Ningiella sp. W23 TaxID=3023715 RepID=UPI00375690BA
MSIHPALAIQGNAVLIGADVSITLSESHLRERIQALNPNAELILKMRSRQEIEAALRALDDTNRAILTDLWIRTLSYTATIETHHQTWLNDMQHNQTMVQGSYTEHPGKVIPFINIPLAASSAIYTRQVSQLKRKVLSEWANQSLNWAAWLSVDDAHSDAVIAFLKTLKPTEANAIAIELIEQGLMNEFEDNHAISILLSKHYSQDLFAHFLKSPPDEFTYQYLQKLPLKSEHYEAVEQLAQAIEQPKLSSQALLSLATHYSDDELAQALILSALDNKKHQLHAVAALERVKNEAFRRALQERYNRDNSPFAKLAIKQLQKAALK